MATLNGASRSGTQYNVVVDNLAGVPSPLVATIVSLVQHAGARISQWLPGTGTVDVHLVLDTSVPVAVGGAQVSTAIGSANGVAVHDSVFMREISTGSDTNGSAADVVIRVNPSYGFFYDSSPGTSDDLPAGQADFLSTVQHELTHGLAFTGYRDFSSGALTSTIQSPFDVHVTMIHGQPFFTGSQAMAVYGGPVPLSPGNIYHYGTAPAMASQGYLSGIMNGPGLQMGVRYDFNDLDLAIFADCGMIVSKAGDLLAYVWGTSAADHLVATSASVIHGMAGDDNIQGSGQNDIINAGAGNDRVDGGAGLDTIVISSGALSMFSVLRSGSTVSVSGAGSTVVLSNVERVMFADGRSVALDIDGNGGMAYRLYKAAFNRVPDEAGLGYQMTALDNHLTLSQVARNFIDSPEFSSKYGALSNSQFVTQLYRNVLGREPEADGLTYHVNNLNNGMPREITLIGFSESPENKNTVSGLIQNGMPYKVESVALQTEGALGMTAEIDLDTFMQQSATPVIFAHHDNEHGFEVPEVTLVGVHA